MSVYLKIKTWAHALKTKLFALSIAIKHPRTPWYTKILAMLTLSYALSPIDLIPDFIPLIGLLDDLILLPLAIWLTLKTLPEPVWQECLYEARQNPAHLKKQWLGGIIVLIAWLSLILLLYFHYLRDN